MSNFVVCAIVFLVAIQQICHSYHVDRACTSPSNCESDECCVIGMVRYSIPKCKKLGQVDHYCRRYNEPENRTLAYPNGEILEVSDVYTLFCPCDIGHVCLGSTCQKDQSTFSNSLA